jgi:hypothetical protein
MEERAGRGGAEAAGQTLQPTALIHKAWLRLGVLFYELLTGLTPFDAKDLMAAGLDEMRRTIREKEPVRPSTRLSQELTRVAAARQSAGDLENENSGALTSRRYI